MPLPEGRFCWIINKCVRIKGRGCSKPADLLLVIWKRNQRSLDLLDVLLNWNEISGLHLLKCLLIFKSLPYLITAWAESCTELLNTLHPIYSLSTRVPWAHSVSEGPAHQPPIANTPGLQFPPGSGVSDWEEEEAELAASSVVPWERRPRPGGSFMPSCSAISTWSPGWT